MAPTLSMISKFADGARALRNALTSRFAESSSGGSPVSVLTDGKRKTAPEGRATTVRTDRDRVDEAYMRVHPGAYSQDVQPKISTASNHGYVYLQNSSYWDLIDEMFEREPKLKRGVRVAVSILMRRDRNVFMRGEDQDHPRAAEIQDFLQRRVVAPDAFEYLLGVLFHGVMRHGISTAETMWRVAADGAVIPDRWFHAHPGQIAFDRDWDRYLVKGWSSFEPVDPAKYVTATNPGIYDNPYGDSPVAALQHYFYWKKRLIVSWMRFVDKYGSPLAHAQVPADASNRDAIRKDLETALKRLQDDDALVTSHGEKVDWHDRAAGNRGTIHDALAAYLDGEFVKGVLGAALATEEARFGTRSQANIHSALTLSLLTPYAIHVCKAIRSQLFAHVVRLNFGEDAPIPEFEIDTEPPEDAEAIREALKTAKEINMPVSVAEARERLGFRTPDEGEPVIINLGEELTVDRELAKMGVPIPVDDLYERYGRPAPQPGARDLRFDDQNLYQYHLQFGVLTINEVRRSLGLPEVEWGDKPVGRDVTTAPGAGGKEILVKAGLEPAAAAAGVDLNEDGNPDGVPEESPGESEPSGMSAGGAVIQFASDVVKQARALEARAVDALDAIAQATVDEGHEALLDVFRALRKRAAELPASGPLPARLAAGLDLAPLETDKRILRLWLASRLVASMTSWAQLRAQVGTVEFADLPDDVAAVLASLPSGFEDAASWMANRDVLTVAQVRAMAESIAPLMGSTAEDVERQLRGNILALAESVNEMITERIGDMVASAVEQGLSAGDFVAALDELVDAGTIPGGAEGYWANVFRTESANAYSEQQQ